MVHRSLFRSTQSLGTVRSLCDSYSPQFGVISSSSLMMMLMSLMVDHFVLGVPVVVVVVVVIGPVDILSRHPPRIRNFPAVLLSDTSHFCCAYKPHVDERL